MKITKSQLKQIIKEEVSKVLDETPNNAPDADAFRAWLTRASENITEDNSDGEPESRELEPEEGIDAADHAIEIVKALKDLIGDMPDKDKENLQEAYYSKDNCVYKRDDDSKVGCTDGPIEDYMAALYRNVDDAKKKENK